MFPESTMWLVGEGDLLLIGANGGVIDLAGIEQRWRLGTVPALLRDVAVDERAAPFALMSLFAGGPAEMARYAAGAAIQRDDRTALEFSAPRAIYGRSSTGNAATIRGLADSSGAAPPALRQATDVSWTVAGAMELKADAHDMAYDRFRRAVEINHRNAEALSGLSDAAGAAQRQEEERSWLESLAHAEPNNAPIRVELSRLLATMGDAQAAAAFANEAMRLEPNNPKAAEQLASVYADAGDADRLAPLAEVLISRFPASEKSRYYHANALFLKGNVREAMEEARMIVAANPADAHAQNLLGVSCANAGLRDCALAAFTAALAADPRDPATYVNLGVYHLQSANPAAAVQYFSVALTLDRSSEAARQGLAEAQAAGATMH